MDRIQVLDMITGNREYIKLKSNIAFQNLAMLHKSFDSVEDEECILSLALNDSIAALVFRADYTGAISISQSAIGRFPDTSHQFLIAGHEAVIGRCYTCLSQYDKAREHLYRADAIAFDRVEESEEARGLRADIWHDLAMNNHHAGGSHAETTGYLECALEELEPAGQSIRRGVCLMGIGNVRFSEEKYKEALSYYKKAVDPFEQKESYTNLAAVLSNIGLCYLNLKKPAEAEPHLMRSLDLRLRVGSYPEIANSYYNLSLLYKYNRNLSQAYDTLLISRDYALVGQAKGIKLMILEDLADIAQERGDTAAAETHQKQRLEIEGA